MHFKITSLLIILLVINCNSSFAQTQQTKEEAKIQRDKFIQKLEDDQEERIQKFVNELNVDDFQKHIIKQKIQSYYEEKKTIYTSNLKYFEQEEQLKTLDATHFSDLKEITSEEVIVSIKEFVKDNKAGLKKQKKKKKKRNQN